MHKNSKASHQSPGKAEGHWPKRLIHSNPKQLSFIWYDVWEWTSQNFLVAMVSIGTLCVVKGD